MLYYNHANNRKCVQKVGELLNKHEIAIDVFNKVGSIAKTADFVAVGLKNYDVVSLCNQGYIERIRNGFYKLPNAEEPKEEALISKLLPQGIVCVESALFYYGYSDFAPREWTVAVPRSFSRAIKAMQEVPVKAYYVQNEFYHYGATVGNFNGVELKVYDRERTSVIALSIVQSLIMKYSTKQSTLMWQIRKRISQIFLNTQRIWAFIRNL